MRRSRLITPKRAHILLLLLINGPRREQICPGFFDKVRHKQCCSVTEDDDSDEISDIERKEILISR